MEIAKEFIEECVETPSDLRVNTAKPLNRLQKLIQKYPEMVESFKQEFRIRHYGDWVFYGMQSGRTAVTPPKNDVINKIVKKYKLVEP